MLKFKIISLTCLCILATSCTSFVRYTSDNSVDEKVIEKTDTKENLSDNSGNNLEETGEVINGYASFYHNKFHGRKTASGEIYDKDDFTAAHRSLPFGTKLLVRNLENNKTVVVRVNDRGPFVRGRVLDLSRAAAEEIGMVESGVAEVEIRVLK